MVPGSAIEAKQGAAVLLGVNTLGAWLGLAAGVVFSVL